MQNIGIWPDEVTGGDRATAALERSAFGVSAFATALPAALADNHELAADLGVTADWITDRCDFRQRATATIETTGSLAVSAANKALSQAGTTPEFLLCATFTPDYLLCPTAPSIASRLGLRGVTAFDINGACSGGLLALLVGIDLLRAGSAQSVLVVASDTTTKYIRKDDTACRILFGDGAAAFVLDNISQPRFRILARNTGGDGSLSHLFRVPTGGSVSPEPGGQIHMNGPGLYRFAVETGAWLIRDLCRTAQVDEDEITQVIFHQANARILRATAGRTSIPPERWILNSSTVGNLASASVLFAWATHMPTAAQYVPGDKILLAAFGAGLTWAGLLLEFTGPPAPARREPSR